MVKIELTGGKWLEENKVAPTDKKEGEKKDKMKAKKIEKMAYGSPRQNDEADKWYQKFLAFEARHPNQISDSLWARIHNQDIWYLTRHRHLYKIGVL